MSTSSTPSADAPPVTLFETKQVTGPGADAFAAPPLVDVTPDGKGTPLVSPAAPAPAPSTTPEEAQMIGKAVAAYVGLGWSRLAERHSAELAALAPPEQHGAMLGAGVAFVEQSATRLALKYNIRIPYQDEIVVAGAVGTATYGLFGKPKNENKNAPASRAKAANPTPEPKRDRDVSPDVARDQEVDPNDTEARAPSAVGRAGIELEISEERAS